MKHIAFVFACALALLTASLPMTQADPVAAASRPAPALNPSVWVNGRPAAGAAQKGKVTVVLFWKKALSE